MWLLFILFLFFFFKQKSAYEMRISDWISDVCSSDLGREVRRDALDSTRVGELMSTELVTVDGDVSLTDAIGLMERHGVKRLPVISNGKLVGLISRADILRTLLDE